MPPSPCPPQNMDVTFAEEDMQQQQVNMSTLKSEVSIRKAEKSQKTSKSKVVVLPAHTLAWEMNALSAVFIAILYQVISQERRVYLYMFLALSLLDATRYYQLRGKMAGVPYTLPLVSLVALVIAPVRFWKEQGEIACESKSGLSTNSLLGKLMVFVTDQKLCREVMTGEGIYGLYAHPNAKWLFGESNLIYMQTDPHKKFRGILSPALFSNDALTMYARAQERIVRKYLTKFADGVQPLDVRLAFRSMTAAASQESFLGPYLTDAIRASLEQDILLFTLGFLCFPFPYLGTGLDKAVQAKHRIQQTILKLIPSSRSYVEDEESDPRCLLDHWSLAMLNAAREQGISNPAELHGCSDLDVATTVMDFLFAAQDATNSALTFSLDVLAEQPNVVHRIRSEVKNAIDNGTTDLWAVVRGTDELQYTSKAANQILHHKPPVPMVPHIAKQDTVLGGHVIPKGAVVIPSVTYAARTSGSSATFDPERPSGEADAQFVKTPIFGAGQHKCPGRRYAETLLTVFLAVFLDGYDFERVGPRPDVDNIMYYPTVFPSENQFLISARNTDTI